MKKLIIAIILSVFMSNQVFANIDESQTDLYYANGMLMDLDEDDAEDIWDDKVENLKQQNPKLKNTNAKFAYNSSALGGVDDGIEAFFQWLGEKNVLVTWATVEEFVPVYLEPFLGLPSWTNALNSVDLNTQINAYKQSIKDGHGVIVVAHSQGNFFYPRAPSLEQAQFTLTNSAYLRLDSWMRPYFNMIGVASPSNAVTKSGPRVSFDNDLVAHLSGIDGKIINPNRERRTVTDNRGTTIVDVPSFTYHLFDYYMGGVVTATDLEQKITVSTTVAKDRIVVGILSGVASHQSAPSQWENVSGLNGCDCESNRVQVAHKFDLDLNVKLQDVVSLAVNVADILKWGRYPYFTELFI